MFKRLNEKIKNELDEYLEFDTNEIFENTDYCEVFGGAIRDILADCSINDIDFVALPQSKNELDTILRKHGYQFLEDYTSIDINEIYKDIRLIFQPITYINKNFKKVQIIRPSFYNSHTYKIMISTMISKNWVIQNHSKNFFDLMKEVDLSCCGVSFDGNLKENYPKGIIHSMSRIFEINDKAGMFNKERTLKRKFKLIDKGFEEWDHLSNKRIEEYNRIKKSIERKEKLNRIIKNRKNI